MQAWYLPITLLPSVGFFIMATSNISNALSAELARLLERNKPEMEGIIRRKILQLTTVNRSLVVLYISACLLALAGLVAGLEINFMVPFGVATTVLICLAIGFVVVALSLLMIYAIRAVAIKREQFLNT